MADNVRTSAGTADGATFATDDDGTAHHPYVKVEFGADNTQTPVSTANPLPVVQTGTLNVGTVTAVTAITNALPAGTNAIGKLSANAGVTIGAVEVAAAQTLATVTTVSTVTALTTLTGSGIAHDGVDSGNPHKIGGKAETSPKGITLVADGDRTDLYADADGMLMVKLNTSGADIISEAVSNTDGASTAFTNFSAVASTKNYITAISAFRTDTGTTPIYIDFRDGTAGSVLWRCVLPPNGGSNIVSPVPLFKTTANTALAFDVSAATTTVYINVSGYQSKV